MAVNMALKRARKALQLESRRTSAARDHDAHASPEQG
jgi:hypothetical protein